MLFMVIDYISMDRADRDLSITKGSDIGTLSRVNRQRI
jgi:hypothetical protein